MVFQIITVLLILGLSICHGAAPALPKKNFLTFWEASVNKCNTKSKLGKAIDLQQYGLTLNPTDAKYKYNGELINIFYQTKFGLWPYIDKHGNYVNGGLPQKGNLDAHLAKVKADIEKAMPDPNYQGLAIIDFEYFKPILAANYGGQLVYKTAAAGLPKGTKASKDQVESASATFDPAAKNFMLKTLETAIALRPKALWGYYHYPYCATYYNQKKCETKVNDELSWLWKASKAIYPSVYFSGTHSVEDDAGYVAASVAEAKRIANGLPIYVYTAYKLGRKKTFYTNAHIDASLTQIYKSGVAGAIIWGADADFNTANGCKAFQTFLTNTFGPKLKAVNS